MSTAKVVILGVTFASLALCLIYSFKKDSK